MMTIIKHYLICYRALYKRCIVLPLQRSLLLRRVLFLSLDLFRKLLSTLHAMILMPLEQLILILILTMILSMILTLSIFLALTLVLIVSMTLMTMIPKLLRNQLKLICILMILANFTS